MANPCVDTSKHLIDIVKYRWGWMAFSTLLLIPGIIAIIYSMMTYPGHMPLKVGIDYTGGTVLQYGVEQKINNSDLSKTRTKLVAAGVDSPYLQIINVNPTAENKNVQSIVSVRTKFIGETNNDKMNQITNVMKGEYKNPQLIQVSSVGPTLGKELFKNSLIAVALACLGIVAYLTIRFQLDFAIAAIAATLHDVLFVVGCFSILGIFYNVQIDGLFITAILTVIGFSVHDTIVVYDRIRENLRYFSKKMTFGEIVNISINQTFARSINTSMTTLLTLGALFLFGGVTTRDFVLAMILGIAIGTYSSIFFASMVIDIWRERKNAPSQAQKSAKVSAGV